MKEILYTKERQERGEQESEMKRKSKEEMERIRGR
jgi:hypothetical protein